MRIPTLLTLSILACGSVTASDFKAHSGAWHYNGKPFYSTTAHAVYHKFREKRAEAVEDLKQMKNAGFTVVEAYWRWGKDLNQDGTWSFDVFDDFVLTCKQIGLKTFVMFQEYVPIWLADREGWGHTNEEGARDVRVDDFYVCHPTYPIESKRYYTALLDHLKQRPDVSENILYWNMGGEYKPFKPHRQPRDLDYGYDDHTVSAFRDWLMSKRLTLPALTKRWGGPTYSSWDDVWPAVNLKEADYKGRKLTNIGAARWDWYDFRQQVATQHMADAIRWVREAGDKRPMIHEYNIITPGGVVPFLRWSRVGARAGKDGIYQASGTFDREFDFHNLIENLAICRGASDPPWQSNEQKGDTPPEWMMRHAWLMIAMGGTGVHFWDWRSDDWGVVDAAGNPNAGYPAVVRLNAEFDFLGDLLAGSQPMPNRIGILALAEETFYAPRGHSGEISSVMKGLLQAGSACETAIITDDEVLEDRIEGYRLIIVPSQIHMRLAVREKLAKWVRNGGVLWLTPGSASRDETDAEFASCPGTPLDKVAGLSVTGKRPALSSALNVKLRHWFDKAPPFALLEDRVAVKSAKPIAYVQGVPAVFRNRYGKGFCIYQAAYTAYLPGENTPLSRDPAALAAYVKANAGQPSDDLLADAGLPYVTLRNPGGGRLSTVVAGVRKASDGYLLILVEGDNRDTKCEVRLSTRRLGLSGDLVAYCPFTSEQHDMSPVPAHRFETALAPAQVKVFHIAPRSKSARWMAAFKARKWSAIEAKLPPTPQKKLIPPSEIGSIDPGDLAKIAPKPHGDKWLLIDISRHANRSLIDEGKMENAKSFLGSVGVGSNDLGSMPTGLQTLVGVPFDILDAKTNPTSCMITKTNGRPWLGPLSFDGIPVRSRVKRIHWLYGTGWAPFDLPVGYITYRYSDGSTAQENLVCGKNIMNWWGRARKYENDKLQLAWSGETPSSARNYTTVGLYHYAWDNPHPEKAVESINVTSYGGDACVIVVAVTAEK